MKLAGLVVVAALVVTTATTSPARAQPSDRTRETDTAVFAIAGASYLVVEFGLKHRLVRPCVWCEPPAVDLAARNALVWDRPKLAGLTSTVTGYALAPMLASGLLVATTWDRQGGRLFFDDTIPVFEAAVAVGLLHHLTKFSLPRKRPFVKFADADRTPDDDDNASFFSGHTALAFAVTVAGGIVAHKRGYGVEPYIWGGGFALAGVTGYLRIAADKHWLTDVVIGAVIGSGLGVLMPYLHRDSFDRSAAPAPTMPLLGYAGVL